MHEAMLEELGLMPLWQLRSKPVPVTQRLTVLEVQAVDGSLGWLLMEETQAEDESTLLSNMLRAMYLQQRTSRQLEEALLPDAIKNTQVQWVWILGESLAQRLLLTLSSVVDESRQVLQWQNLSAFASLHPRELLLCPQRKAELWAAWCHWLQQR